MQTVVGGILTHYEVLGKGKNSLLILHGWRGNLTDWLPTADRLARKYKAFLVDLPGHGSTEFPSDNWEISDFADFVSKFLDKVKIKKLTLIGHSFGGRVSIVLSTKDRRVDRLALVDAAGVEFKPFKVWAIRFVLSLFRPIMGVFPDSVRNYGRRMFGSKDYQDAGHFRETFKNVVNQDLRDLLPKISVPTTIIWGEKDEVLPLTEARALKSMISNSTLRIVWGAGHRPQKDKFEDFMRVLEEERI